jgi:hypothetical protein
MGSSDGNTARRRPRRANAKANRGARLAAARDWVALEHERAKPYIWVLANQGITRKRFTDFQWAVLQCRWLSVDHIYVRNSSVMVDRTLGVTAKQRARAEQAANLMVHELMEWFRANEHWHSLQAGQTIKALSPEERRLLTRQRKARPKKGRRPTEPVEFIQVGAGAQKDAYDVWTSAEYAGPLREADMTDVQRINFTGSTNDKSASLEDEAGGVEEIAETADTTDDEVSLTFGEA